MKAIKKRMSQAVLADRFQLKFHRATKKLPSYVLVIEKSDLKLQEPKPGEALSEGFKGRRGATVAPRPGQLMGRLVPIKRLVWRLSAEVDRPVIDKTGLTGSYDFILQWDPNGTEAAIGGQQGNFPFPPEFSGVSFFTAVQEQLGLKLESQKGPVEVLIIDHVEKPSEN